MRTNNLPNLQDLKESKKSRFSNNYTYLDLKKSTILLPNHLSCFSFMILGLHLLTSSKSPLPINILVCPHGADL